MWSSCTVGSSAINGNVLLSVTPWRKSASTDLRLMASLSFPHLEFVFGLSSVGKEGDSRAPYSIALHRTSFFDVWAKPWLHTFISLEDFCFLDGLLWQGNW